MVSVLAENLTERRLQLYLDLEIYAAFTDRTGKQIQIMTANSYKNKNKKVKWTGSQKRKKNPIELINYLMGGSRQFCSPDRTRTMSRTSTSLV